VKKLFVASRGFSANKGNRNIRLESTDMVYVNILKERWIRFKVSFGEKYVPLVKELVELAKSRKNSYSAKVVFRNGRIYLHLSVPIELYLKYFRRGEAKGDLIAGFDLNSNRINMVIVDRCGVIRDVRIEWFPEVTSPGYPRNKAKVARLQALAKLLNYAYHHGVGVTVFEDLDKVKQRAFTSSPTANSYLSRELGLDKHTASAYMLTARYLGLDLKSVEITQITRKTKN